MKNDWKKIPPTLQLSITYKDEFDKEESIKSLLFDAVRGINQSIQVYCWSSFERATTKMKRKEIQFHNQPCNYEELIQRLREAALQPSAYKIEHHITVTPITNGVISEN